MTRYDSTDEYYGTLTIKDLEDNPLIKVVERIVIEPLYVDKNFKAMTAIEVTKFLLDFTKKHPIKAALIKREILRA